MREMGFSVFLMLISRQDLKRKRIPVWPLVFFAAAGIGVRVSGMEIPLGLPLERLSPLFLEVFFAMIPGLLLLAVTGLSRGAVGAGDGCFFLAAACYLDWREVLFLLAAGLFCCSIFGLGWILFGAVKGCSVRKKRLPFLPFLLPAWLGLLCLR